MSPICSPITNKMTLKFDIKDHNTQETTVQWTIWKKWICMHKCYFHSISR